SPGFLEGPESSRYVRRATLRNPWSVLRLCWARRSGRARLVYMTGPPGRRRGNRTDTARQEADMEIADREVLVTGGNRGIGRALVDEALGRGAKRVYAGTRRPLAHPDGRVTPLMLDVTDAAQIQAAAREVESLDVLINNSGIWLFDDLTDRAALERHLAVNLFGIYGVTQAFLPLLTSSRGTIVNNLSLNAL